MSDLSSRQDLVTDRGAETRFDAHITGCTFSRDMTMLAFATGEGDVIFAPVASLRDTSTWTKHELHDGPVLSIAPDVSGNAVLTGGEDCILRRSAPSGSEELGKTRRWIEHVTSFAGKTSLIALACGKQVELRDASGRTVLRTLEHPSTVSGIAFDGKGKRIAASHYNGASLWFTASKDGSARPFSWKGSHTGIAIHPDGEALVTAMQENELHGWRLSDGHNMRMSGYPSKIASMAFTRTGKWLATSGADCVVLWPFFNGGPIGKPPAEMPGIPGTLCTRVATHPTQDVLAAGFADGSILLIEYTSERVLPVRMAGNGSISALAFNGNGAALAWGTEEGAVGAADLSAQS
ncbi:WD40 repeat domain-containing protein [Acetobacter sp. AN02]|uniref:WD40 repeat domain-containing protein n=1 Tax=Acetobacter sp. AN02 TaxID=2894186 RepID=UPI002434334E|nr:WD40 repeat domain-containing protein [Acetobacter sp. AN02]MDG6094025.1 WD40 repeat domain-containing protein [Acetobacter sp. AN02]